MKTEDKMFGTGETKIIQGPTMKLEIVGDHPLAKDGKGALKSRIGTVFTNTNTLVTVPGIHATQRMAYIERLNRKRNLIGVDPVSDDEQAEEFQNSVDVVMEGDEILIRPDPDDMGLAFRTDDILQEIISKQHIKFLYVANQKVKDAIKQRGEYWRISPVPKLPEEMVEMISTSRIGIIGKPIYYYNRTKGSKLLTLGEFERFGDLTNDELRAFLSEIREYGCCRNRQGCQEIEFFMANDSFGCPDFTCHDFPGYDDEKLREVYGQLRNKFGDAVPAEFHRDDPEDIEWRNRMFAALTEQREDVISDEPVAGLSSEFFLQIEWLPGGRIEEGEFMFDSVFEEKAKNPGDAELDRLCDEKSRGFIFNFIREYGDLEYVNIGRMAKSLSLRPAYTGRRDVYIAEIKQRGSEKEIVRIIRMQKWGVKERLDVGKSLQDAIIESEEYTEYILDRRLGCHQLGMNLPSRVVSRKISEKYHGNRAEYNGITIWSPYFERDYIYGIATDKMPKHKLENEAFALSFAHYLGLAAAPNMIVGRTDLAGKVVFDDGDEVVIENRNHMPEEIIVADHTGTFNDYQGELESFVADYALPVNRRLEYLPDPEEFAHVYLLAFVQRFSRIQEEYRKRRRAFDTLFKGRRRDEGGSFAYRWEKVLERLNRTDPLKVADSIRRNIQSRRDM